MPNRIFLKVDGIDSESKDKSYDDHAECVGFSHEAAYNWTQAARNKGATTEVSAGPVTVIKSVGKDSPLFMQHLHQRKKIKKVEIKFERDSDEGTREHFYTIVLEDVRIAKVRPFVSLDEGDGTGGGLMEEVGFAYSSITWTYEDGGIEGFFDFTDQTA